MAQLSRTKPGSGPSPKPVPWNRGGREAEGGGGGENTFNE